MSEPEQPEQTTPAYVPESRLHRGVRYSHRTGLYLSLAIALATLVFLILLIARNTTRVKVDYVLGNTQARLVWLVIISAITGWVLGIVTGFLVRRRTRWRQPG
ncbi:MAG: LapA family protein [Actinobacteria bacterium]|nr:LapA family protein [Actinomycetota bacterium]